MATDKGKNDNNNNNVVAFEQTKRSRQKQNTSASDNKPVKRRRNRPDLEKFGEEFTEPGDNARYIEFALGSWNMPKVDFNNAEQVVERINWYFRRCMEHDMKPGVVGLSNALGVTRQTLWNWKEGVRRADATKESVDAIKKAYGFLEELWEDFMMNGKVSPPNGIFIGKNHFNYKDVQDVVIAPQNGQEQEKSVEDVRKWLEEGRVETEFADGKDGAEGAETGL